MAVPMGPTQVVETGSKVPTVQVPQETRGFTMSKRDQILLFSRDLPLSRQQSTIPQQANPQGAAPSWAKSVNNLMVTTTTGITDFTQKVEKIAHDLVPGRAGSEDDFVHLKAEIIIQKKLLVLDLSDLLADTGDDLAEVLGQHVSVQLVGTTIDPSKLPIENTPLFPPLYYPDDKQCTMHSKICSRRIIAEYARRSSTCICVSETKLICMNGDFESNNLQVSSPCICGLVLVNPKVVAASAKILP